METLQQSLLPHLDECLSSPMTEPEKLLVKILELVQIEKYVPGCASLQWLGRLIDIFSENFERFTEGRLTITPGTVKL